MTLNIALLGTGRIAEIAFVPAVKAVDGAALVSVLSRDQARGEAFAKEHDIPNVCTSLEAILRNPQVDAVIVATPDAIHERQVIAAVEAGKHVLCEKPMAPTTDACRRMADAVRASGVTFAVGFSNRFNNGLKRIKELIEAGEIGTVRYARALMTTEQSDPKGWRALGEQSRYWALSATGAHTIDIFRWYFGEPASVGGGIASPIHNGPNDEIATLVLDYPGRLLAELTAGAIVPRGNRIEIFGEGGTIIAEDVFGLKTLETITCKGLKVEVEPTNSFFAEVADFVDAVREKRQPSATAEDGLRNVHIMEVARNGKLQLPL